MERECGFVSLLTLLTWHERDLAGHEDEATRLDGLGVGADRARGGGGGDRLPAGGS